jgi:hypothetical protein
LAPREIAHGRQVAAAIRPDVSPASPSSIDFTDIDVVTLEFASLHQVDDLAGFSVEPVASPVRDLSDPTAPKLRLPNQTGMDYRFFLAVLYPPDEIIPHRALDPSGALIGSEYTFGLTDDAGDSVPHHPRF